MKGLVTKDLKGTTTGKILEVGPADVNGERPIIEVDKPTNSTGGSTASMEFYFAVDSALTYTRTIGTLQAATYASQSISNVASVVYKKNTVTVSLPFTLAASDTLEVTITRTAAGVSIVTLTT